MLRLMTVLQVSEQYNEPCMYVFCWLHQRLAELHVDAILGS